MVIKVGEFVADAISHPLAGQIKEPRALEDLVTNRGPPCTSHFRKKDCILQRSCLWVNFAHGFLRGTSLGKGQTVCISARDCIKQCIFVESAREKRRILVLVNECWWSPPQFDESRIP